VLPLVEYIGPLFDVHDAEDTVAWYWVGGGGWAPARAATTRSRRVVGFALMEWVRCENPGCVRGGRTAISEVIGVSSEGVSQAPRCAGRDTVPPRTPIVLVRGSVAISLAQVHIRRIAPGVTSGSSDHEQE